jgi:type 1 glutamine amidotransferase
MRTSCITGVSLALVAGLALALPACQEGGADDPVYAIGGTGPGSVGGSSADNTSGSGTGGGVLPQGGSGTQAGSPSGGGSETVAGGSGVAGSGTQPVGGSGSGGNGTGGSGTAGSGTAGSETGGTGTGTGGGSGGTGTAGSGTAGSGTAGSGTAGAGGGASPPVGRFKMLAYCETRGFPHPSIPKGLDMLKALGAANDFEVVVSDGEQTVYANDPQITANDLASFNMVFFMNTTGDIFSAEEQTVFMTFLKEKKAFAGVHSATDTEKTWTWYEELVGEIYDGHSNVQQGTILIEEARKNHPAVAGIPSPWTRNEEWYKFEHRVVKDNLPGLTVLMRFGGPAGGGATVGQPLAWTREWEGIRSFYSALGHDASTYEDAGVRKHLLGGILWAVGRVK